MTNMLITGAASGIGRAAAIRMSGSMHVIAAALNKDGADAVADEIRQAGGEASR